MALNKREWLEMDRKDRLIVGQAVKIHALEERIIEILRAYERDTGHSLESVTRLQRFAAEMNGDGNTRQPT